MSDEVNAIALLKLIASAIARTLGPFCEVVIHDLRTKEIVFIENGHITGRKVGDKLEERVYEYLTRAEFNSVPIVGYPSKTRRGEVLKSTTIVIRNKDNCPIAAFCINLNIGPLTEARNVLANLTETTLIPTASNTENCKTSVKDFVMKVISDAIQTIGKPISLTSKEDKLAILQKLDEDGVFLVKDMVPYVCELLSVSQATLYNYLREIRAKYDETFILGQ